MSSADLAVTKTAGPAAVSVGQQVTYTIAIKNSGPDSATGVVLTDTVPAGACLNAIALSPQVGSYTYTGNTIKWTIGSLAVNAAVTLTATVSTCSAGVLVNTAIVTANEDDPNPNNNSATATVTVTGVSTPTADLSISKVSCPNEVAAGAPFTYLISAINNGPVSSTGVIVTDTLPPGLVPVSAVSNIGACTISGNTVTCQIGTMTANERVKIAITVQPTVTGVFTNTAAIIGDGLVPDPNPDNNTDSTITEVQPAADLAITKTAFPGPVVLGDTLTYTVTVVNNGPADADAVVVTESLPTSVTVLSIDASQGTGCVPIGNNEYLCSLGDLANGATATITVVARPTEPGCIFNTASVDSSTREVNPCNNTVRVCTQVRRPEVDVVVRKTHTPEPVTVCSPVEFSITVSNNGPFPASGVVLVDQLPAGFQVLSVCSSQGCCHSHGCGPAKSRDLCDQQQLAPVNCSGCGHVIVCHLGALAVGASAIVKICTRPCQNGVFTNTAIVTANEEDTDPANNQATDTVVVITFNEQINRLLDLVNDLVAAGDLSAQNAACLLADLARAKHFIDCGNCKGAECPLSQFIKTVYNYINHGLLNTETGCRLIKIAESIILGCNQPCQHEGDECCGLS